MNKHQLLDNIRRGREHAEQIEVWQRNSGARTT
jgi:hypothetical protein